MTVNFGSTMPAPRISSQPVFLQTLHPFPLQMTQAMSTSALGSVNGKKLGRRPDAGSLAEKLIDEDGQISPSGRRK